MMGSAILPLYLVDLSLLAIGGWFLWPALRQLRVARTPQMAPAE